MFKSFVLAGGILLLSLGASAQKISVGVVAGGSLTDGFQDRIEPAFPGQEIRRSIRYWSPSKDFVVGGMFEVRFSPHWSLEVDGLFRQLSGKWAAVLSDGTLNSVSPHPVVTWEFPVLAKYRFQGWKVNPFFEAGPSFRTAGNLNSSNPSHYGVTAGAGVEIMWRSLKIGPVVRYTRWARDKYPDSGAQTAPNQVELLVGFSREPESNWQPLGRHISLGATLGTNLNGDLSTDTTTHGGGPSFPSVSYMTSSGPRSLIIGPTVEVQLPHRFSVEVDALYRPISSASESVYADGTRRRSVFRAVTWVFPVLAKYKFPIRGVEPFIGVGPSFRLTQCLTRASPYGVTAAAGVEFRLRHLKIAPAVRFTHWGPDRRWDDLAVRNHAELLVGLTF